VDASFSEVTCLPSRVNRSFISGCEAKRPCFSVAALFRSDSRVRKASRPFGL